MRITSQAHGMSPFELMFFVNEDGIAFATNFFSCLPLHLTLRLGAVNHCLRDIVKHVQREIWNIDVYMRQWVDDPKAFRTKLGECDAIIPGVHALNFLDRSVDIAEKYDAELEIFMRLEGVLQMGSHLQSQGYEYDAFTAFESPKFDTQVKSLALSLRRPHHRPYQRQNRILKRFDFTRAVLIDKGLWDYQTIQLVVVPVNPILSVMQANTSAFLIL